MNYKRKSRRRFFLLMRLRTPPISSEFRGGGGFEHPKPPLGTPLLSREIPLCYVRLKSEILFSNCKMCLGPPCLSGPKIESSLNNAVARIVMDRIHGSDDIREGWDWEGEVGTSVTSGTKFRSHIEQRAIL